MPDPAEQDVDARRILDRAARESEALATSSLSEPRRLLGRDFAGPDVPGSAEGGATDPAEVWGRRVGRVLSVPVTLLLVWWLGHQLGWWGAP